MKKTGGRKSRDTLPLKHQPATSAYTLSPDTVPLKYLLFYVRVLQTAAPAGPWVDTLLFSLTEPPASVSRYLGGYIALLLNRTSCFSIQVPGLILCSSLQPRLPLQDLGTGVDTLFFSSTEPPASVSRYRGGYIALLFNRTSCFSIQVPGWIHYSSLQQNLLLQYP